MQKCAKFACADTLTAEPVWNFTVIVTLWLNQDCKEADLE